VFSDARSVQAKVQGVCRGCPVREACLKDAIAYEGDYHMTWGVVGGLTDAQRRALRVEAWLGNRPSLEQARALTRPRFAEFMRDWKDWPADVVAAELRKHGVLASPVTVRLALWWTGAKASVLPPLFVDDRRRVWMVVRDECRQIVYRLREMGVSNADQAAYLGVGTTALEWAVRSWRAETAVGVRAA
jgi:hypothetical protein